MIFGESSASASEEGRKYDLAVKLIDLLETQLALGENRASVLLAVNALLAAAYATVVKDQELITQTVGVWAVVLAAAVVALVLSLCLSLWAIFPALVATRFKKSDVENLLFFGDIAHLSYLDFEAKYKNATPQKLEAYILTSIHGKSEKACKKFTVLFCAAISTFLSILFFAIILARMLSD